VNERQLSIILLPTLNCNADCAYCFEKKSKITMSPDLFAVIFEKIMRFLETESVGTLHLYWQGGEVMVLSPEWFSQAHETIWKKTRDSGKRVVNYLQTNLMGYTRQWNPIIQDMFGNSLGTSMDFPNLHRRLAGSDPQDYEKRWRRKVAQAREAGIQVGMISVPNPATLEAGAGWFYARVAEELGISEFQINTPFAGGPPNRVKDGYPLDPERLADFLLELAAVWKERGLNRGVRIGPLDRFIDYFINGNKDLHCIWRDNCANDFFCIDPQGYVSQCDCWAASYPDFRFGNLLEDITLSELLRKSEVRRLLLDRPGALIQREDCIECDYLGICHGGCPVRAYSAHGQVQAKDPYCPLYRRLFGGLEKRAASAGWRTRK